MTQPKRHITTWLQPTHTFQMYADMGVTTLYGYESESGTVTRRDWLAAADALKLWYILQPDPVGPARDLALPGFAGWMGNDEPDLGGPVPLADVVATYQRLKTISPTTPVWLNISSQPFVLSRNVELVGQYLKQGCDVGSCDVYPEAGWAQRAAAMKPTVAECVGLLRSWSGGKPTHQFMECGSQHLPWIPTAAQMTPSPACVAAQIWACVAHGITHIGLFPQDHPNDSQNGFRFETLSDPANADMKSVLTLVFRGGMGFLSSADSIVDDALIGLTPQPANPNFPGLIQSTLADGRNLTVNFSLTPTSLWGRTLQPYDVAMWKNQADGGDVQWQYSKVVPRLYGLATPTPTPTPPPPPPPPPPPVDPREAAQDAEVADLQAELTTFKAAVASEFSKVGLRLYTAERNINKIYPRVFPKQGPTAPPT